MLARLAQAVRERTVSATELVRTALERIERLNPDLNAVTEVWAEEGRPLTTDNGNYIIDCAIGPIENPTALETDIRAIPGVVGTGLFVGMADVVLVGDGDDFRLIEERRRL